MFAYGIINTVGQEYFMRCEKNQCSGVIIWITVILFGICTPFHSMSQSQTKKYLVRQITFEGNIKTKSTRLLREVVVHVGDSLSLNEITKNLKKSKENINNTGLFTDVTTNLFFDEENKSNVRLHFKVREGLYFITIPIIELADRNFNVWWTEHNRNIKFLNLGLNLKLRNISGNADELYLLGQWGYDRKFIVNYESPYFDLDRKWNFNFRTYYNSNKELIYNTLKGDPQYLRDDNRYLRSRFETSMAFNYRPGLNSFYKLTFGYFFNSIEDEVFELNSDYFVGQNEQRYAKLKMEYILEKRNNKYLATEGWYVHGSLSRNGLAKSDQLKSWELEGDIYYYHSFNDNLSMNHGLLLRGHYNRETYPYFNLYELGTDPDYIRGYEYYHIQGSNLGVYKTSLMHKFLDRKLNFGKIMPFSNYKEMDTKLFLSLNLDYGYVFDEYFYTSNFVNKNLWGGGLGLNILLYNKFSCSFEASMNQRKEVGVFFHLNRNF